MTLPTYLIAIITYFGFSSFHGSQQPSLQYPLRFDDADLTPPAPKDLSFIPPGAAEESLGETFRCEYPSMAAEYTYNPTPENRSVWLKHRTNLSLDFDINTDYETRWPVGIERKVCWPCRSEGYCQD